MKKEDASEFQRVGDAAEHVFEKIPACALHGAAAHLFVVEARRHADAAALPLRQQRFQRGIYARQVVDAGGSEKFAVRAEGIGGLGVDEKEVVREDLLVREQSGKIGRAVGKKPEQGL